MFVLPLNSTELYRQLYRRIVHISKRYYAGIIKKNKKVDTLLLAREIDYLDFYRYYRRLDVDLHGCTWMKSKYVSEIQLISIDFAIDVWTVKMIQNVHACCFDCFVLRRRCFDATILQRPFGIGFKFLSKSNATVIRTGELILFPVSTESSDRTGCRSSKTG